MMVASRHRARTIAEVTLPEESTLEGSEPASWAGNSRVSSHARMFAESVDHLRAQNTVAKVSLGPHNDLVT
ncbi:hypothetical protein CLAIMM_01663 [Cladophialophora immunda]|nr:hypothetical protein CLAIMM_01663 [Cladophialophora immunda]